MIMDYENLMTSKDGQAITGTAASTNVIDLGDASDKNGIELEVLAQVVEDFDNLTSLKVELQTSTDEAFSSPIELASQTILLADLEAGKQASFATVPLGCKRFVRGYFTVTGTNPTAGKIVMGLTVGRQTNN